MMAGRRDLFLYNTAGRKKELFVPVNDPAGLYCCGPTVYNYAHIGNLRTYIFEDVLKRALKAFGYAVRHIVNITDVGHLTSDEDTGEDKMEKGARREGRSVWEIAALYTDAFMKDIASLNIIPPDMWPKATDHIPHMIDLIRKLESGGFTYRTSDGIYFDTSKFPSYADFAGLDIENLHAGKRVDMGEKRNATDFALWKFSPADSKRQMEWDSPWGVGFPGWHIECSAMSLAYLKQPIDIHCGGADHIPVHHTNEIAQSEAATGKRFVRYWLHGEFLVLDKGKMAKSGDRFITMESVRDRGIDSLAYRMFCYTAHYRSPLNFSWEGLDAAAQSLLNLRRAVSCLPGDGGEADDKRAEDVMESFYEAVGDDLNMPRAMAAIWDIVRNEALDPALRRKCIGKADEILALDLTRCETGDVRVFKDVDGGIIRLECPVRVPDEIGDKLLKLLSSRHRARLAKDWPTADGIRKKLGMVGIEIKDRPDGSTDASVPLSLITGWEQRPSLFE